MACKAIVVWKKRVGDYFCSMYSREESAQIRQQFWTSFGKYMGPVPSAGGDLINWVNYKTGVKGIYIRSNAERHLTYVALEIVHNDIDSQHWYYDQLLGLKSLLPNKEEWTWSDKEKKETGKPFCSIYKSIDHVNVYRKSDWPEMITFLKSSLIDMDAFWYVARDLLEIL